MIRTVPGKSIAQPFASGASSLLRNRWRADPLAIVPSLAVLAGLHPKDPFSALTHMPLDLSAPLSTHAMQAVATNAGRHVEILGRPNRVLDLCPCATYNSDQWLSLTRCDMHEEEEY